MERRRRGNYIVLHKRRIHSILLLFILFLIYKMPKSPSDVVKRFRVRIDGETDELVMQFFKEHTTKYLLVHHVLPSGNPHYHAYCETHYSQGNFSNKIKSVLGVAGGDYSNKTCDPDRVHEYLSYLFNTKNGNEWRKVSSLAFSILDIKVAQEHAQLVAKEFAARMKLKKLPQFDIVEMVISRLGSKGMGQRDDGTFWHPGTIYDEVIEVMRLNRCVARPHHIRDVISSVMAWSPNAHARSVAKELALKYFNV